MCYLLLIGTKAVFASTYFMDFFGFIHRTHGCCLHCGSFFVRKSLFCQICENLIWRKQIGLCRIDKDGLKITSLFSWEPNSNRLLSNLLMAQKDGNLSSAIEYYAKILASKAKPVAQDRSIYFIPCPAGAPDRNHAQILAEKIAEAVGASVLECLIWADSSIEPKIEQKKAKLRERQNRSLRLVRSAIPPDFGKAHVIFIDDIVTTGSTAKAAKNALAISGPLEVWALAYRQPSDNADP